MTAAVEWLPDEMGQLRPHLAGSKRTVVWAPQPGAQQAFLECPVVEVLLEGNRGGGKTDAMLMDFAQHVGRGYGIDWRGVLFRRKKTELDDLIDKTRRWYWEIFPDASYNEVNKKWTWQTGESLHLTHFDTIADYQGHHGQSYAWIGWEELNAWPSDDCYTKMMSCLRSARKDMPRHVRATTNPGSVGHGWIKRRFRLPVNGGIVGPLIQEVDEHGVSLPARCVVHSILTENVVFLNAEPNYTAQLSASAKDPMLRKAWIEGSWDIVSGGMFDDLWTPSVHVLPSIQLSKIPRRWTIDRAYDDGQSKPFSVGWYAQSNGEPMNVNGRLVGAVRGDLIRVKEWYGWSGVENQGLRMSSRDIARGILEREDAWGIKGRVRPGPADTSIWTGSADDPSKSVASEMAAVGVEWVQANKAPGSRVTGWSVNRDYLRGALPGEDGRREDPGLFVTEDCIHFLRTIPVLPRSEKNPDDVNTDAEDHVADEVRYRCRAPRAPLTGADRMRAWSR